MEEAGSPYLVPLSVPWDGITSNMVTPSCSQTGRNLQATDKAYLGSARSTSSHTRLTPGRTLPGKAAIPITALEVLTI